MPPTQRWQYLTQTIAAAHGAAWLDDRLAALGDAGWELVAVTPLGGAEATHQTYVFKRPVLAAATAAAEPDLAAEPTAIERPERPERPQRAA